MKIGLQSAFKLHMEQNKMPKLILRVLCCEAYGKEMQKHWQALIQNQQSHIKKHRSCKADSQQISFLMNQLT